MTNKETVERHIGLTFDFVHHLIDNPDQIEHLPEKFKIEFLEKDFSKLEKKEKASKSKVKSKFVRVKNKFEML